MVCNKIKFSCTISTFAMLIIASVAYASPTVTGNVISWTEEGWHQVQVQSTYKSVCNGGRQCTVADGVYTVINHGTGERFANVVVPNNSLGSDNKVPAPVAATGQLSSHAFGDDGDFQAGIAVPGTRFHDNEDGTFTDALTGITWLGIRDCIVKHSWARALEYANTLSADSDVCSALSDGSVSGDWRMPNIKELYSLIDISDDYPALAADIPYSGNWSDFPWDFYWSSSSFEPIPKQNAFVMDIGFGLIWSYVKNNEYYAWPIRIK